MAEFWRWRMHVTINGTNGFSRSTTVHVISRAVSSQALKMAACSGLSFGNCTPIYWSILGSAAGLTLLTRMNGERCPWLGELWDMCEKHYSNTIYILSRSKIRLHKIYSKLRLYDSLHPRYHLASQNQIPSPTATPVPIPQFPLHSGIAPWPVSRF